MKKITIFKLIKANLETEEAKKILLELFVNKINFHERDKFSNETRFGIDLSNSTKRIDELKEEKQKLVNLIDYAFSKELKLSINCNIEIELINK